MASVKLDIPKMFVDTFAFQQFWWGGPLHLLRLLQFKATSNRLSGALPDVIASWFSAQYVLLSQNLLVASLEGWQALSGHSGLE